MSKISGFMLGDDVEKMVTSIKDDATKYTKAVLKLKPGIYGSRSLYKRRQFKTGWQLEFPYTNLDNSKFNNKILDDYCEYNGIGECARYMRDSWRNITYGEIMSDDKDIAEKDYIVVK